MPGSGESELAQLRSGRSRESLLSMSLSGSLSASLSGSLASARPLTSARRGSVGEDYCGSGLRVCRLFESRPPEYQTAGLNRLRRSLL